jgi:hypothetical protein
MYLIALRTYYAEESVVCSLSSKADSVLLVGPSVANSKVELPS